MTDDGNRLFEAALALTPKERAELAAKLVASVSAASEAEEAWNTLIYGRARRVLAQELGTVSYLRKQPKTTVRFELDAEVDLERGATWYAEHAGRMDAFLAEVEEIIAAVQKNAGGYGFHAGVPQSLGVRRAFLREFPYTLAFVRVRTEIRILAVAHAYRMPSDGEISITALVTVEDWLVRLGVRALTVATIFGLPTQLTAQ